MRLRTRKDASTVASTLHVPERTCVGCRGKAPRSQLLRLVLAPGPVLEVDARATRPGRGAWIHPDPGCLSLAERRRALGRALRTCAPLDAVPVRRWLEQSPLTRPGGGPIDCEGG